MTLALDRLPSQVLSDSPDSLEELRSFAQTVAANEMLGAQSPRAKGFHLVWIGSSCSHWFIAKVSPADFKRAFSEYVGTAELGPMPWARPHGCLDMLVRAGFSRAGVQATELHLDPGFRHRLVDLNPPEFGCSCFFTVSAANLNAASLALLESIPGACRYSGRGGPTLEACTLAQSRAVVPAALPHATLSYLEMGRRWEPPSILVDGQSRYWAFWVYAAARAMGCPPELSISKEGISFAINGFAIREAARRLALRDTERFEADFAEAIILIHGPNHAAELKRVRPLFEARDRICVLSRSTGPAQAPSQACVRL